MSAVYTQAAFDTLVTENFEAVVAWFESNEGKSVDACASALTLPYEVVYQIVSQGPFVILPNASGELHWNQKSH